MARGSVQKTCPNCNTEFKTYLSQDHACCCAKCAGEQARKQTYDKYKQTCEVCGKEFLPPRPKDGARFCSYTCSGIANRREKILRGGYWRICRPEHPAATRQGYVAEHRLIMEQAIGRYLAADEVVHHINHDGLDNRLENLQLLTNTAHRSLHMKEAHRDGKLNTAEQRARKAERMRTNNPCAFARRDESGKYTASAAGRRVDA